MGLRIIRRVERWAEAKLRMDSAADDTLLAACGLIVNSASARVAIDTGSLANSFYMRTPTLDTYTLAATTAANMNPRARITDALSRLPGKHTAVVASTVEHAFFQEFGAQGRPPRPAFVPAVEEARARYGAILTVSLRTRLNS